MLRRIGRQILLQQAGCADDDRQEVVEIVCDTAGEVTDCTHLLRLPELLFQLRSRRIAGPLCRHATANLRLQWTQHEQLADQHRDRQRDDRQHAEGPRAVASNGVDV